MRTMPGWVKCSILVIATSSMIVSIDATSCLFKHFEFMDYTEFCFADQQIPDHFPLNLSSLFLGTPPTNQNNSHPDCSKSGLLSYLPADKAPISGITALKWMAFCNFNFNDGRAERISQYLEHVKSTLETLQIQYGKLTQLNAGVLRRFTNLKVLDILYTGLEDIEPGAFSEVTLNGPALVTGQLALVGNRLTSFDWSLLQPMALGLEVIILEANEMKSMKISEPLFFPNLHVVDLSNNNLKTIPAAVMQSFPRNLFDLNALGNPFCPTDSLCRCCSMRPLWETALNQGVHLGMSCGPGYKDGFGCPNARNSTTAISRSTCLAGCNTLTTEMVDLAQYESCTANNDPHVMACDLKRTAQKPSGRSKKRQRSQGAAMLH